MKTMIQRKHEAEKACANTRNEIVGLLNSIQTKTAAHALRLDITWASHGDLQRVKELLQEAVEALGSIPSERKA